ncbi:MAG TPA: choice-of-anchor Q domain-containing protein [Pyrinomonadaceae bacterium]|nr:choice-of-anchor Q domain-containing protein [Pyrinomonadaceae bacterium]
MPLSPNHRGRSVVYLASICVVTIVLALATPTAKALAGNTIIVNSTLDVADGTDGLCTLREAITAANTDTASGATAGECVAGSNSDSDTITLTGVAGTITLLSALPNITADVSINGPGASQLTISGNNNFRVFSLTLSSGLVSFSGLTITNGRISNDVGGGIYNQSSANVNVTDTTISNGFAVLGGGIANSSTGTFTITNSTLINNSASTGGGCYNGLGTLNVINSTLNNNSASNGNGGGIITGSTLNIINSTLHGNFAGGRGGAIYHNSFDAQISISQSTIVQNTSALGGGGVGNNNGGPIRIINTIVAHNVSNSGPDLLGPFVTLGHNLLTNFTGSSGFTLGTNNANGDLVGASFAPLSPLLGPLQNNGGPTQTIALLPGSPAINAGDNCVMSAGGCLTTPLTTDQRGISRQVNQTVDMGAFESRAFTISVVSGTPQSKAVNTLFAPLVVTVNSASGDPVAGGLVLFKSPAFGPSAVFATGTNGIDASIAPNGQTSTSPTANGIAGGPYEVTATISGTAISASFNLTNTQAATTTTVTSSANPSDLTQSVTFTATVTSTGTPTGFVQFKIDGTNFGSLVPLSGGVATISTAALTAGAYSVSADYSGDSNFTPSSGTLSSPQIVRLPPALSINDISFAEGDAGTKFVFFTVTSTSSSNLPISVDFTTGNSTATSPSDYQAATGTLTFSPLQTTRIIVVTINGDTVFEPDETFTMTLSNPVNATIGRAQGLATIQNDEAPVLLTEQNTNHVIALDSVTQVRDPFPLATVRNFSADQHTRVSLFVWRLGLLPGDTIANVIVKADDGQGTIYTLTVEAMAVVTGPDDVTQLIVRLPDNVTGAPRNLGVTVLVHGPISNKAFISIAGP